MTNEEFKDLITRFNEEELKLQSTKGAEYRRSDDVLANFKRLGDALGIHPALVCMIYLQKHMDSIISFVKNGMDETTLAEPIMGRIQDARNYLLLLAGIIEEFKRDKESKNNKSDIQKIIINQINEILVCGDCFFWQVEKEGDIYAPCGKTGFSCDKTAKACSDFRRLGEEE